MDACTALKRFSACPFLRASPAATLRSYSTQRSLVAAPGGNRLAELAQTQCPLMRVALVHRAQQLHTSAAIAAPASASAGANHISPKSTVQPAARGYASIAEVQHEAIRRAVEPAPAATPAFVNPASIAPAAQGQHSSAGAQVHDPKHAHAEVRPTCALGFAKHAITSHRPGFDYETFYGSELTKKHQDKSYRVRCTLPFEPAVTKRTGARSTSTMSTGSLPSTPSLTRPTRLMK